MYVENCTYAQLQLTQTIHKASNFKAKPKPRVKVKCSLLSVIPACHIYRLLIYPVYCRIRKHILLTIHKVDGYRIYISYLCKYWLKFKFFHWCVCVVCACV